MLAVVATSFSRLMSGSAAYVVSSRLAREGEPITLIDVEAAEQAFAERLGESVGRIFVPADRGLPSIIASHEELTLQLLADHCYTLDATVQRLGRKPRRAGVPLWILFGPHNRDGCMFAAQWLVEHFEELNRIDSQRRVMLAASLPSAGTALAALLARVSAAVVISQVETEQQLAALRAELAGSGLLDGESSAATGAGRRIALAVLGNKSLDHELIAAESGIEIVGDLNDIHDERVLNSARRRRLSTRGERLVEFVREAESTVGRPGSGSADGAGTSPPGGGVSRN